MTFTHETSLREVAFTVCSQLHRAGIRAVLTGGSAATVYASQDYLSRDLDFIIHFTSETANPAAVLAALGYSLQGDLYVHEVSPFTIDFPPGPLSVGRDLVTTWETLEEGEKVLHILSPTDCCRDRLTGFLFWNDRGSLEQAVTVAHRQADHVDLDAVRAWCEREGFGNKFEEFLRALPPTDTL